MGFPFDVMERQSTLSATGSGPYPLRASVLKLFGGRILPEEDVRVGGEARLPVPARGRFKVNPPRGKVGLWRGALCP